MGTVGIALGAVTVIDPDRARARQAAREAAVLYLPVVVPLDPSVSVDPELIAQLRVCADRGDFRAGAALISDELLDRFAFAGNPADIIGQCERLYGAGVDRIEFGTPHGLSDPAAGITLLGGTVLPALKDLRYLA